MTDRSPLAERDRRGRRHDRQRRALGGPRPGDRDRHQRHPQGRHDPGHRRPSATTRRPTRSAWTRPPTSRPARPTRSASARPSPTSPATPWPPPRGLHDRRPAPTSTPPAAPTGLTATGSQTGIALDWADNTEADLAGYDVYRSTSAGGTFVKLTTTRLPPTTSAYNDTAAPAGATSFYRVTASDTTGNESDPATADAARPAPPAARSRRCPAPSVPVTLPFSLGWGRGCGRGRRQGRPRHGLHDDPAVLDRRRLPGGQPRPQHDVAGHARHHDDRRHPCSRRRPRRAAASNGQHNAPGRGLQRHGRARSASRRRSSIRPPATTGGAGRPVVRHQRGQLRQARRWRPSLRRRRCGSSWRARSRASRNGTAAGDEVNTGNLTALGLDRPAEPGPESGDQHRDRDLPDRRGGAGLRRRAHRARELLHRDRPRDRRHGQDLRRHLRDPSQPDGDPGRPRLSLRRVPADQRPDRPGRPDRADRHRRLARPRSASTGPTTARPTWPATTCTGRPTPKAPTRRSTRAPSASSAYTDTGLTSGTLYAYQVRALDASGNVSAASAAATALHDAASPPAVTFPVQVNFQSETAPDPGRLHPRLRPELRQRPGLRLGRARHGHPAQPGRQRPRPDDATSPDQRLDTLMHMQGNNVTNFANVALPGAWEIAVPNGTYSVEVSVGDPTSGRRPDVPRAQRRGRQGHQRLRRRPTTTGSARWSAATVNATVSDGRLTIDPIGGTNTKINYVVITRAADTTPPAAPVITTPAATATTSTATSRSPARAEAGSTVELFDGATSKGTTTATGGTWSIALTGVADGVHAYTAKATDAAPNTSGASNVRTITVDTAAPTITARSPLADATGVAVDVNVSVDLLRGPRRRRPSTGTSVTLKAGTTAGPGDRRLRRRDRHDQPDPDADLASGTTYTVSLAATITDLAGNDAGRHLVGLHHGRSRRHDAARRADARPGCRQRHRVVRHRRPDQGRHADVQRHGRGRQHGHRQGRDHGDRQRRRGRRWHLVRDQQRPSRRVAHAVTATATDGGGNESEPVHRPRRRDRSHGARRAGDHGPREQQLPNDELRPARRHRGGPGHRQGAHDAGRDRQRHARARRAPGRSPMTSVADGVYVYTATATDAAGNVSLASAGRHGHRRHRRAHDHGARADRRRDRRRHELCRSRRRSPRRWMPRRSPARPSRWPPAPRHRSPGP